MTDDPWLHSIEGIMLLRTIFPKFTSQTQLVPGMHGCYIAKVLIPPKPQPISEVPSKGYSKGDQVYYKTIRIDLQILLIDPFLEHGYPGSKLVAGYNDEYDILAYWWP